MAHLKNNDIGNDPIEVRLYRLLRMQNNIDTHRVELGISGPLLTWARGSYDRFSGAVTVSSVESGESVDANKVAKDKFFQAKNYYQRAKEILIAFLDQYKPDEILMASYKVDQTTSKTYNGIIKQINSFVETHNRLIAEGDDRVVAQSIIDNMVLLRDAFLEEIEASGIEEREMDVSYKTQHSFYNEDTEKLRLIYKIACMVWGDDDPRLKDLGFVPSSEIWTPGSGEPEPLPVDWPPWPGPAEIFTAVLIEPGVVELVYSGVQEATIGYLDRRKPGTADWILVADDLPMNAEDILPFRDYDVPPGTWEYRFTPIRDGEKGVASFAIVEVKIG